MTGGGCAINPKAFLMGLGVAYANGAVSAEAVDPSADQWMDSPSTEASPDGSIIIERRLVIDAVSLQVSSEGFCGRSKEPIGDLGWDYCKKPPEFRTLEEPNFHLSADLLRGT